VGHRTLGVGAEAALIVAFCGAVPAAEPDLAQLAALGARSLKRIESEPVSWSVTMRRSHRARVTVRVLRARGMRRTTVAIEFMGARHDAIRIVERDGVWHVAEKEGVRGKYRPYEAPFAMPAVYIFLQFAELAFVAPQPAQPKKLEGVRDGVASFRSPVEPQLERSLRRLLAKYAAMVKQQPALSQNPKLVETMKKCRALLKDGIQERVSLKTGLILERVNPQMERRFTDLVWQKAVEKDAFSIDGQWTDFTGDPTAGDVNELVMINHVGAWRPGMPHNVDTGLRLLDLKTGQLRRVPFRGPSARGGCFLSDRRMVVVTGMVLGGARMGLYAIDLKSGRNMELGGEAFATGFCHSPAVSPDGARLAALRNDFIGGSVEDTLKSQLYVVDLETQETKKIGPPLDCSDPSWLPDGSGFILETRKTVDMNKPAQSSVARMGMDGRVTRLRAGGQPVLLADGRTILFREKEAGGYVWKTCGLDGKNARRFHDGLPGHGFPSLSPEGKRLLMMRFEKGKAPSPQVIDIATGKAGPAIDRRGLWAWPCWR